MTSSGTRRRLIRTFDRHGADLNAVASVLTPDSDLAEHLLVRAVITAVPGDDLRRLSAVVVREWLAAHAEQIDVITPAEPSVLDQVHTAHQRAALALCRFGTHTYREAADVLGLPAPDVAHLLTTMLRSLRANPSSPSPETFTEEQAV